jgi:hypothetical protein
MKGESDPEIPGKVELDLEEEEGKGPAGADRARPLALRRSPAAQLFLAREKKSAIEPKPEPEPDELLLAYSS